MTQAPLLAIRNLTIEFQGETGSVRALDSLDLEILPNEVVGLVGESGSGKSVTALAILGLVPLPGKVIAGEILFSGRDLRRLPPRELRKVRGQGIAITFQEPASALHPLFTVGAQIVETVRAHEPRTSRRRARERAIELLRSVRMPDPTRQVDRYPHELSGGMRQRAMLAIALAGRPRVLLADEPTTALDASIESEVLELIETLRRENGLAVLLISHDLSLVAARADRVAVLRAGKLVESGAAEAVLRSPEDEYTRELLLARPRFIPSVESPLSREGT